MFELIEFEDEYEYIENKAKKRQQKSDGCNGTSASVDELLEIKGKSSVWVDGFEVVELLETPKYEDATKNSSRNLNTNRKNEGNYKNVKPSRKQNNNFDASGIDSTVACDKVNTKCCCKICTLFIEDKIVLNCKFCDLNNGDSKSQFHLVQDISQENVPRNLRRTLKGQQKSPVAPPQKSLDELLDSCGSIFKLKYREFFIVCGSSEIEYALDLFERHVPHHHIFEQSRIKSETSKGIVDTRETYKESMKLLELIKLEKETVIETIQPKLYANYNKSDQKSFTRNDSESDLFESPTQKIPKLMDKKRSRTKKMESKIVQEESYEDQINEEYILGDQSDLNPLYKEQIPKRILKCDKQFGNVTNLNEGKKQIKVKKFNCTECELKFFSENKLSLHMHHKHSIERIFKCPECPKGFKRNADLKIHKRIHTGEKPFACDICNKCFRAKQNLTIHRKFHMGEAVRAYECEYCDKKFIRNIDLRAHTRTHTGEKPYKCDICQRGYSSKTNLNSHLTKKHTLPKIICKPPFKGVKKSKRKSNF